jgi:hypothetical protein
VPFVTHNEPAEVKQPGDAPFNDPPSCIASKWAAILCLGAGSPGSMRADEFDLALSQLGPQLVAIGSLVVDQPVWNTSNRAVKQWLDQLDFSGRGAGDVNGQWKTVTVDNEHELGSLPSLGLTNISAPFFAGQNVPSPNASDHTTSLRLSSCASRRDHACSKIPAAVHSCSRRQQVLGDGKCGGMSFHLAPVLSTQMIPSKQARGWTRGLPPSGAIGGCGNKSAIKNHCSSESCGFGSVLDPVMFRPVPGRDTRVLAM